MEEKTYEEIIANAVADWDVAAWEETNTELVLHVCSTCGLIASELIDHGECSIQDWWELNVMCFVKPEPKPQSCNARHAETDGCCERSKGHVMAHKTTDLVNGQVQKFEWS